MDEVLILFIQVYANGPVTFQQTMHTTERINIHYIKPFQR